AHSACASRRPEGGQLRFVETQAAEHAAHPGLGVGAAGSGLTALICEPCRVGIWSLGTTPFLGAFVCAAGGRWGPLGHVSWRGVPFSFFFSAPAPLVALPGGSLCRAERRGGASRAPFAD